MRILLIDPPFFRIIGFYNRYFPFGLVTLATFLRAHGYPDVRVCDADFNDRPDSIDIVELPGRYPAYLASLQEPDHPVWHDVENTLREQRPDVVGISIWTAFAAAAFLTARIAKRVNPDCAVVLGGPHATVKAEEILALCPEVDYVIRGDGEYPLLELVTALEKGGSGVGSIQGLSYRAAGHTEHCPPREKAYGLDEFPFPDRTLLMHESRYTSEDMGLIMATRGCPYACTFCATTTRRVSFRSPDHILAEMRAVKARYGTTQFTFKDDSFTVNAQRVEEFCHRLLAERLRVNWECNTRVNLINEPLLRLMKKAGCNFIKVGVESGSPRILEKMNKGITPEQTRAAARLFRKVGIHWTGYFMMGVPGETEEDIRSTVDFLYELRPDFVVLGVYEPYPGTRMFDDALQRGLVKQDMTLEDFHVTLPNHYYRRDPSRQTDLIPPERFEQLDREIKDRVHQHNRHPLRLAKMACARSRVYCNDPRLLWTDVKKFLSY